MNFYYIIEITRHCIAFIGASIIACSAAYSFFLYIAWLIGYTKITINYIRLEFGSAIILGLEFLVGADIIQSIAKPDYYDIGLLGLLVLIRTFLSYFLNKELEQLSPQERSSLKNN